MSNIIPLTDPRVLARLEAIERRLDALMMEPEHRDDDEIDEDADHCGMGLMGGSLGAHRRKL